jgi:hypothetical protein
MQNFLLHSDINFMEQVGVTNVIFNKKNKVL